MVVFLLPDLNDINFIWISAEVSNDNLVRARVTRKEYFNTGAVVYEVPPPQRPYYDTNDTSCAFTGLTLYPSPPGLSG